MREMWMAVPTYTQSNTHAKALRGGGQNVRQDRGSTTKPRRERNPPCILKSQADQYATLGVMVSVTEQTHRSGAKKAGRLLARVHRALLNNTRTHWDRDRPPTQALHTTMGANSFDHIARKCGHPGPKSGGVVAKNSAGIGIGPVRK